ARAEPDRPSVSSSRKCWPARCPPGLSLAQRRQWISSRSWRSPSAARRERRRRLRLRFPRVRPPVASISACLDFPLFHLPGAAKAVAIRNPGTEKKNALPGKGALAGTDGKVSHLERIWGLLPRQPIRGPIFVAEQLVGFGVVAEALVLAVPFKLGFQLVGDVA